MINIFFLSCISSQYVSFTNTAQKWWWWFLFQTGSHFTQVWNLNSTILLNPGNSNPDNLHFPANLNWSLISGTAEGEGLVGLFIAGIYFIGLSILGDPGAVSRVGKKGAKKVFKYGRKSPWVLTLTELFPNIQADTGSWLGTRNALYYCAQSANSFSWVLFVSPYTTAIVSPHLPRSFTKLVRTRETFIFYFPNQKQRNYR